MWTQHNCTALLHSVRATFPGVFLFLVSKLISFDPYFLVSFHFSQIFLPPYSFIFFCPFIDSLLPSLRSDLSFYTVIDLFCKRKEASNKYNYQLTNFNILKSRHTVWEINCEHSGDVGRYCERIFALGDGVARVAGRRLEGAPRGGFMWPAFFRWLELIQL